MRISFITTNKNKASEASAILKEFDIQVEHTNIDYPEDKEGTIQKLVTKAIKPLTEQLKKPVVIEDTGLFFDAYKNYPGLFAKTVYESIGFKGIQKLLENESRKAHFLLVVGYCEPGKGPVLFEGRLHGTIKENIFEAIDPVFPYDTLFIPESFDKPICEMSMGEKNAISHRGKAFRKLGEYLTKLK
jgi:XTP/dITP diphosphohydrolase